jgi:signal transduction histidine kinase
MYCGVFDRPGVLRPEHRHYSRELRLIAQRSEALIGRLLGELSPGAPVVLRSPAGAAEVLTAITPLLESLAFGDAVVHVEAAHGLPALPFDPEILERILVNLTRNAAAALHAHNPCDGSAPSIRVCLRIEPRSTPQPSGHPDHYLRLTVADNGPGMSTPVAAAFMKPSPLSTHARHGLGHRIVHALLASSGGVLSITVAPGKGTTMQMDWPLVLPSCAVSLNAT